MGRLCNATPAFFRAQHEGAEFYPAHRYPPLAELTLLRARIRHRRGRNKSYEALILSAGRGERI